MTRMALLLVFVGGCGYRQEIRDQHCASVCIANHGAAPPLGAYGSITKGDRCYCQLWNQLVTNEGKLDDGWRPE